MSNVQVKPLEWETSAGEDFIATAAGAEYLVELSHNGSWYYEDQGPFADAEAAKAAAQADYEVRIRSVLVPAPAVPDDVAQLRSALRDALAWIDAVPPDTPLPTMPGFDRDAVNALLDAHPAPDAVAEADPADEAADRHSECTHCYGRSANDRCLNCGAPLAKGTRP